MPGCRSDVTLSAEFTSSFFLPLFMQRGEVVLQHADKESNTNSASFPKSKDLPLISARNNTPRQCINIIISRTAVSPGPSRDHGHICMELWKCVLEVYLFHSVCALERMRYEEVKYSCHSCMRWRKPITENVSKCPNPPLKSIWEPKYNQTNGRVLLGSHKEQRSGVRERWVSH